VAPETRTKGLALAEGIILLATAWSGIHPFDRLTWAMEVAPVVVSLPIVWFTHRRYPLTTLVYGLLCVHALLLLVGGAYTYAEVPLGFWLQETFALSRNPYDKIGHFAQGFVPALVAREVLIASGSARRGTLFAPIVLSIVLAISAAYELLEWAAAVILGEEAEAFLGTQGDPWDTQSDMAFALFGAVVALAFLSRVHDRQMAAHATWPAR